MESEGFVKCLKHECVKLEFGIIILIVDPHNGTTLIRHVSTGDSCTGSFRISGLSETQVLNALICFFDENEKRMNYRVERECSVFDH